ncbi:MAG: nitrogenase component 1 [Dethiobacter sp.]|jgi:nitrogenase molybdenum-iron protein alpha/beta subunit|nr:nitrogenase component 1 [Dethiobacter sp.]
MQLYKYLPQPSDRMGTLWALATINDACIIEYGPAGTTHYALEGLMQFNAQLEARLFTTHMDENDIIMGDSTRLEETIREVDAVHNPPVIFVLASSIASIVGTDIQSICENLQEEIGAKLICFTSGGFRGDYTVGIREVLTALAENMVKAPKEKLENRYNIIGCNIDSYNFAADCKEVESIMKDCFGFELNSVFTANSSVKQIEDAARAKFNLVLRGEGSECAEILKERFDMDYYIGCPYGFRGTLQWVRNMAKTFSIKANDIYLYQQLDQGKKHLMRINHALFNYSNFNGILAGSYDFVTDIHPFLTEEIMINIEKVIVNHSLRGEGYRRPAKALEHKLAVNPGEEEKEVILSKVAPEILLGDGVLLEMGAHVPVRIQVANPNPRHYYRIYDNTPFMGFNGAIYLIETILNQIHANRKELKARF